MLIYMNDLINPPKAAAATVLYTRVRTHIIYLCILTHSTLNLKLKKESNASLVDKKAGRNLKNKHIFKANQYKHA